MLEIDFNNSITDRWMKLNSSKSMEEMELIAVTCWAIWLDRNKKVHNEEFPPAIIISQWIRDYIKTYTKMNLNQIGSDLQSDPSARDISPVKWSCPPSRGLKLNTDATWGKTPSSTGLGAIVRDSAGRLVGASSCSLKVDFQVPIAELMAIS